MKITGDCTNHDNPDLWFPESPNGRASRVTKLNIANEIQTAVGICNSCPSKSECLQEGMKNENIANGIWGGLLAGERVELRFPDGFDRELTENSNLGRDTHKALAFLNRIRPWLKGDV